MKKEDMEFLNQMIESMEEGEAMLEKNDRRRDAKKFEQTRALMINIHDRISEMLR